jgi:hypothetical protein
MTRYYVHAWGMWFSMVHGWQQEPELERSYCLAVAEIVKEVQPGVTLVEVSA